LPPSSTSNVMSDSTGNDSDGQRPFKRKDFLDAVAKDKKVTHGVYCVISELAHYANNKTGRCWPGHATIAERLRYNKRTVRDYIKQAITLGWVEEEEPGFANQYAEEYAHYRLLMPSASAAGIAKQKSALRQGSSALRQGSRASAAGIGDKSTFEQVNPPVSQPNSQELSIELSHGDSSEENSEHDLSRDMFTSELRKNLARKEEREGNGRVDALTQRCIDIFVLRESTRDSCIPTIERLREEGVGDTVIDEVLGYCEKKPAIRHVGYVRKVAPDWLDQRTGGAS
jgi:hypothetical protein